MSDFHQVNVSTESAIKLRKDQKRYEAKLAALLAACDGIEKQWLTYGHVLRGPLQQMIQALADFRAERGGQ